MQRNNALALCHAKLGAHWITVEDQEIVEHYGDWTKEYKALRTDSVAFDLSYRTRIRITGKHRQTFLHGMVTQNVKEMAPNEARAAAMCTHKGKTVASFLLITQEDDILLDVDPNQADSVINTLNKYIITEDVTLTNVSTEIGHLSLQGPLSTTVLIQATGSEQVGDLKEAYATAEVEIAGYPLRAMRHSRTGEMGFDLFVPLAGIQDVWQLILDYGASCAGYQTLNVSRVESGIPWMTTELNGEVIPVEAGLHHAISYTKGCYIGQEVIAKIKYLGEAPKRLKGLRFPSDSTLPPGGTEVFLDDKRVGHVTSAVYSPAAQGPIALAYIKTKHATPGNTVTFTSTDSSSPVTGEIFDLPLHWGTGTMPAASA